jgi:hypothetical protein
VQTRLYWSCATLHRYLPFSYRSTLSISHSTLGPAACSTDADCGTNMTCSNLALGYPTCACKPGFASSGSACVLSFPTPSVFILGPNSISSCLPFSLVSSLSGLGPSSVAHMRWEVQNDGSLDAALLNQALLSNPTVKNFTFSITQMSDVLVMKDNKVYNFQYFGVDSFNRTFTHVHFI